MAAAKCTAPGRYGNRRSRKRVTNGYGGKGVFYVIAGGNTGRNRDHTNNEPYANHYAITPACAVDKKGVRHSYSRVGATLWVCTPSDDIVTTDNWRYSGIFGGTSAAAPQVAGLVALIRSANPDLTWRDVKLILADSARRNAPGDAGWRQGESKYSADSDDDRYWFNFEYGFGVADAGAAVALALDWTNLPPWREKSAASGSLGLSTP